MGVNSHEAVQCRVYSNQQSQLMSCEHTPHYYETTIKLQRALLTASIHSHMGYPNT